MFRRRLISSVAYSLRKAFLLVYTSDIALAVVPLEKVQMLALLRGSKLKA